MSDNGPRCTACGLNRGEAYQIVVELDLWDADCCDAATWVSDPGPARGKGDDRRKLDATVPSTLVISGLPAGI